MLKALYDYAIVHQLTLPPGFVNKTVKAWISLYEDGGFHDIEMGGDMPVPAPDIGSLANGKDKSNILLEKRSVVIPETVTVKSRFFLAALRSGAEFEPALAVCADALENEPTAAEIRRRLDEKKIKDSDRISFKVGLRSVLDSEEMKKWWVEFRRRFNKTDASGKTLCLITGQPTVPMATTPPINGLYSVGGHGRGDALIGFDKNSFCSYGLKQSANAPVSEEAFASVKAALDELLKSAPTLAGMKFVHWYDKNVQPKDDLILQLAGFGDMGLPMEEPDEEESGEEADEASCAAEKELAAKRQADSLVKSVKSGEQVSVPADTTYYILLLTGVSGRVMIRRYERGSYQALKKHLEQWYNDIELTNIAGTAMLPPCKLAARLIRLLKYQKGDRKPFDRMSKELSGITPGILNTILSGTPLPDAVAARALAYIRSGMQSAEGDTASALFGKDAAVWQWLKVYLIRNYERGKVLMSEYNAEYPSVAYHCGAMLAVYEAIQKAAMPDVNVTVVQRFYASAIQTPALVLGRLSQLSIHHLESIKKTFNWLSGNYKLWLQRIATAIRGEIPATLTLEQQSEFALGYYQMGAELNREKAEHIAAKKERDDADNKEE